MSVFPVTHAERLAPGSFQQPVPIPAHLPGAPDLVQVCFNKDWLPYILGCLFQLTLSTTWIASSEDELNQALGEANNLILIFQQALASCTVSNAGTAGAGDDFMLRQSPDNPCLLQTSVDGVNWCTWADLSKCNGQPTQPAAGTPTTPAGGCQTAFGEVAFGSRWMLPWNVSAGDVITVSAAQGTWASALDLYIPRCPDGNLFFEVGCVEGTGHTEPGDPAPAINHNSLIAFDGTNYYDCGPASDNTPVTITIPPGIANANLFFLANTPDTTGFGSVTFDVKYCNNATPSWTKVLNFAMNTCGVIQPIPGRAPWGTWLAGSGFVPTTAASGGCNQRRTEWQLDLGSSTLTSIDLAYNLTAGLQDCGGSSGLGLTANDDAITIYSVTPIGSVPAGTNQHIVDHTVRTGITNLRLYFGTDETSGSPTGSSLVYSLTLTGTGPEPTFSCA